jgi:phosphonoacetaldehyde hydrolase
MTRSDRIRAVLLDWAGTTVDHGSCAPARVFVEIFRRRGVPVTEAEARGPMGMAKRDHIRAVGLLPRVHQEWRQTHGRDFTEADIDGMYSEFLPLQKEVLASKSDVIAGVPEAIAELRARGIAIGSSTGYTRDLMEVVSPAAARQGYQPDVLVVPEDVAAGRPAPWLNFRIAELLGVYPMSATVAVDDTPAGIEAGLAAGAWTVAVSRTGNALGLSADEIVTVAPDELRRRIDSIAADFLRRGAHGVIESVADLPAMISELDRRRAAGERP